ncbi:MAG: hypothetical protein LBT13_07740 [Treponema sp.]|nr:hypothetical protein [Treponema sp.]
MEDGEISGNTASSSYGSSVSGGGVYNSKTFTMEGGEISGNTASGGDGVTNGGGGVYNTSTFTKTSGVIYGDTDNTHTAGSKENTVLNGYGHAVFSIVNDVSRKRNSTAGTGVNLDSGTLENWE